MTEQNIDQELAERGEVWLDIDADLVVPAELLEEEGAPRERSLLRLWAEVLSNIETVQAQPIPMVVASKIVATWPQLTFQDCAEYHRQYHNLLLEVRQLVTDAIADNPGAIDLEGEDDIDGNFAIYKQLVIDWNILLDQHELEWRADAEDSHITFGALVDVRGFLFSRTGFAGHLEARGVEISADEVRQAIFDARGDK